MKAGTYIVTNWTNLNTSIAAIVVEADPKREGLMIARYLKADGSTIYTCWGKKNQRDIQNEITNNCTPA